MRSDDRIHIRKLAPRHPRTITKWLVDANGGFAGVEQQTMRTSGFHTVTIPANKMIVYVNQKEFSDFRGISLLRACYKHWVIAERMQLTDAIAKEKRSLGVDVGTLEGEGGNMAVRRGQMERALMTLHSHEKQFFTEVKGQTAYRLEGLGRGGTLDPLETVEYHDLRILRALLAEFIAMGDKGGSLAQHRDKTSFFIMALAAVGEMVGDTTDVHLIRKMVDYNFGPQEEYPHFRHSRLDTRAVKELADAVKALVESGVLIPGPDDEDEMRTALDFPDRPDDSEARTPPPPPEPTGEPPPASIEARRLSRRRSGREDRPSAAARGYDYAWQQNRAAVLKRDRICTECKRRLSTDVAHKVARASGGSDDPSNLRGLCHTCHSSATAALDGGYGNPRRKLTTTEQRVDFAKLEAGLDDAQEAIVAHTRSVQVRQIDNLVEQARGLIRNADPRKLEDVNVMLKSSVARGVQQKLTELFELGYREAERELEVQGVALARRVPTNPFSQEDAARFLGVQARAFANMMGDRLRSTYTWEMLQQFRTGTFDPASLEASLTKLSDREIRRTAGSSVTTALNLGRQAAAVKHADKIEHAIFSSVLDTESCSPCEELDGVELELNDPRFEDYRPPYSGCDGRGRCRCVYVYVSKSEQSAVA